MNEVDIIEQWLIKKISQIRGISEGLLNGLSDASYTVFSDTDLMAAINTEYGVSISLPELESKVIRDLARTIAERKQGNPVTKSHGTPPPPPPPFFGDAAGVKEIEDWIIARVAKELRVNKSAITPDRSAMTTPHGDYAMSKAIRKRYKCAPIQMTRGLTIHDLAVMVFAIQDLPDAEGNLARFIWQQLRWKQRKAAHCLMFGYAWLIPFLVLMTAACADPEVDFAVGVVIALFFSPFLLLGWWQLHRSRKFSKTMREYRLAYTENNGNPLFAALKIK